MSTATIDHAATKKALKEQAAAYLGAPVGWPAAMAARALRLQAGHPPYSSSNHLLIIAQLWSRFEQEGMSEEEALIAAMHAAAEEIAPRYIWQRRGYTPTSTGKGLNIWSRPVPIWIDPKTGNKVAKETPGAQERKVFRLEKTYLARDVIDADGNTAHKAPELPAGEAREVFERLAAWISGQGWHVHRTSHDMTSDGSASHLAKRITVHGGLTEWAAVATLAHEIAHAILHHNDDRTYAGKDRGDMEAEAESVAYGLLALYGQEDLARGAARYATEWTNNNTERVAAAYERSCHVVDALAAVALGEQNVTVADSDKAKRAATKAANKKLAAELRAAGIDPKGEAWRRAKAGEPIQGIINDLTPA